MTDSNKQDSPTKATEQARQHRLVDEYEVPLKDGDDVSAE